MKVTLERHPLSQWQRHSCLPVPVLDDGPNVLHGICGDAYHQKFCREALSVAVVMDSTLSNPPWAEPNVNTCFQLALSWTSSLPAAVMAFSAPEKGAGAAATKTQRRLLPLAPQPVEASSPPTGPRLWFDRCCGYASCRPCSPPLRGQPHAPPLSTGRRSVLVE